MVQLKGFADDKNLINVNKKLNLWQKIQMRLNLLNLSLKCKKELWEKEKMQVNSNFSYFYNVFKSTVSRRSLQLGI